MIRGVAESGGETMKHKRVRIGPKMESEVVGEEFRAMHAITKSLLPLSAGGRRRVLAFIADRIAEETALRPAPRNDWRNDEPRQFGVMA
jgi:hypothetical protein